jgi:hypothetical protein
MIELIIPTKASATNFQPASGLMTRWLPSKD